VFLSVFFSRTRTFSCRPLAELQIKDRRLICLRLAVSYSHQYIYRIHTVQNDLDLQIYDKNKQVCSLSISLFNRQGDHQMQLNEREGTIDYPLYFNHAPSFENSSTLCKVAEDTISLADIMPMALDPSSHNPSTSSPPYGDKASCTSPDENEVPGEGNVSSISGSEKSDADMGQVQVKSSPHELVRLREEDMLENSCGMILGNEKTIARLEQMWLLAQCLTG
jgi:hypothetical protein